MDDSTALWVEFAKGLLAGVICCVIFYIIVLIFGFGQ